MPNVTYDKRHAVSSILTAAVGRYRFVSYTGGPATSSDNTQGISEQAGAVGQAISLVTAYSHPVEAAEAIAAGAYVKPSADGTGRAVNGTKGDHCGRALSAAAAGDAVVVRFIEAGLGPSAGRGAALDSLVSGAGRARMVNRSRTRPCAFMPTIPISVSTAFTGTHSLMTTAPGDFDAVAVVAMNVDTSPMTIDATSVAVSERSDTSKTVPIIGGQSYNVAAGGTQKGFVPVTWDGGATSVTLAAAASAAAPVWKVSDWVTLSSVPRVDDPTKFPLVLVREYFNARTLSTMVFPSAAEVDSFHSLLAPYEWYQTAQATVDGATPANAANYTATWAPGASTQTMRIFGLLFRIRGSSDTFFLCSDSIGRGGNADGTSTLQKAANMLGGWFTKSMLALANKSDPVGFVNASIAGDNSTSYLARGKAGISALRSNIWVYVPYTTNDAPTTPSVIASQMARMYDMVDYCVNSAGAAPLLCQATPVNRPLVLRLDANTQVAEVEKPLAANLDLASPIYDPANAANYYFVAGANQDDTHPSNLGHSLVATPITAAIRVLRG